jgi:hypothetical protein
MYPHIGTVGKWRFRHETVKASPFPTGKENHRIFFSGVHGLLASFPAKSAIRRI